MWYIYIVEKMSHLQLDSSVVHEVPDVSGIIARICIGDLLNNYVTKAITVKFIVAIIMMERFDTLSNEGVGPQQLE